VESGGGVFVDPIEGKHVLIADALVSLLRPAAHFDLNDALMDDLDRLAGPGRVPNFVALSEAAERAGVQFSCDLAALLAAICLHHWYEWGAEALSLAPYLSFPAIEHDDRVRLLRVWLRACAALADYHFDDERDPAAQAFIHLAMELSEEDAGLAIACAMNACGFANNGTDLLDAAATLVNIATGRDEDAARVGLMFRALGLYRLRNEGAANDLELCDAFETACRYSPTGPRKALAGHVLGAMWKELEILAPYGFLWRFAFEPDGIDPSLQSGLAYVETEWTFEASELANSIQALSILIVEVENRRLQLLPRDGAAVATADLNRWAIDHRAFRHAIPLSNSLLHEANWADLLLTIGHELIHIESAQSWLGINLLALRIAATGCELDLLGVMGQISRVDEQSDVELSLARLDEAHPVALALVEQQLELVRKAQLLRAVWLPWLEGIAVFGELSADPRLDPMRSTAFADVLVSLNDQMPGEGAEENLLSIEAALSKVRADAERLYADALADSGRARLRYYLDGAPERYLAGYLAVRAVLSHWRTRYPMHGLLAHLALLGATRGATRLAVPDLGLSPAEFEAQARAGMINWLRMVSTVDAESLGTLDGDTPWEWNIDHSEGPPRVSESLSWLDDELREREYDQILAKVAEMGAHARSKRSARQDEFRNQLGCFDSDLVEALDLVAQHTPEANANLTAELVTLLNDRMSVLPIGQVTAPFWLWIGAEVPRIFLGIRVTETDRTHGRPGYSLFGVPITHAERDHLRIEMNRLHGVRMEVTRYVDISLDVPGSSVGRGLGRNVIGLKFGNFTKVLAAGQLMGSSASESLDRSVQGHLRPPSILDLDASIFAGQSVADRAIDWLGSGPFAEVEGLELLAPWADHVLQLARVVREDDDVQLVWEVSERVLTELGWPDDLFSRVCDVGLRGLYDAESPSLGPLLEAALTTGAGRGDCDLAGLEEPAKALLFEGFEDGYDFRRFKEATG